MENAQASRWEQGLVGQRQRRVGQLEGASVVSMNPRLFQDGFDAGDPHNRLAQKARVVKVDAVFGGEPAVDGTGWRADGEDTGRLQTDGRRQPGRGDG
jgi:hypothetical protein